jgi:hypothetical protein
VGHVYLQPAHSVELICHLELPDRL